MEVPINAKSEELMDFKKFVQSVKKLLYCEEKVFIKGTFREVNSGVVFSGDDFWANEVHESGKKINAELIYRTYLDWFNRSLRPHEKLREFVHVKFGALK